MSTDKQIIQLPQQGLSQRRISKALKVSGNKVAGVLDALHEYPNISESIESLNGVGIHRGLFPEESFILTLVVPDFPVRP